jgi:peptidoglycan/LPS O-acetylase OafA/YrhL
MNTLAQTDIVRERPHMPALDGLRGIAVLLVIVDHMCASISLEFGVYGKFMSAAHFGWSGVDLFFVLSGFLITGILYDAKPGPHYFKNFYARRALRIFPLYYVALIGFLIAYPLLQQMHLEGRENPAWMFVYLTNFVMAWNGDGSFGMFDHFWSLAVEEHFYFVWPAVVFFFRRRTVMGIAVAAMVIAFTCRVAALGWPEHYLATYVATPMRMDSLAAGAFIALAARAPGGIKALVKPAFVIGTLALVAFAALALIRHTKNQLDPGMSTFGYSLLWAFYGSVLVLALKWRPLTSVMSNGVLRWFGKYSYGMYVWHPIIFIILMHSEFVRDLRGQSTPLTAAINVAVAIGVMLCVTLVSWYVWEKQFLKLKARFPERARPTPDLGTDALVAPPLEPALVSITPARSDAGTAK